MYLTKRNNNLKKHVSIVLVLCKMDSKQLKLSFFLFFLSETHITHDTCTTKRNYKNNLEKDAVTIVLFLCKVD